MSQLEAVFAGVLAKLKPLEFLASPPYITYVTGAVLAAPLLTVLLPLLLLGKVCCGEPMCIAGLLSRSKGGSPDVREGFLGLMCREALTFCTSLEWVALRHLWYFAIAGACGHVSGHERCLNLIRKELRSHTSLVLLYTTSRQIVELIANTLVALNITTVYGGMLSSVTSNTHADACARTMGCRRGCCTPDAGQAEETCGEGVGRDCARDRHSR